MSILNAETICKLLEENQELRRRIAELEVGPRLQGALEKLVDTRIAELAETNEQLEREIADRKWTAETLRT